MRHRARRGWWSATKRRTLKKSFARPTRFPRASSHRAINVWYRADEFDTIRLTNRGRWSWIGLAVLLFLNLFWNGIVSLFIGKGLGLFPGEGNFGNDGVEFGLLLFMIPFVAVGLLMMAGFVLTLLEPVRVMRWTIDRHEVRFQ